MSWTENICIWCNCFCRPWPSRRILALVKDWRAMWCLRSAIKVLSSPIGCPRAGPRASLYHTAPEKLVALRQDKDACTISTGIEAVPLYVPSTYAGLSFSTGLRPPMLSLQGQVNPMFVLREMDVPAVNIDLKVMTDDTTEGWDGDEWHASSTLKKRRLKMNKHKYRKRRKRDRQRNK